MKKNGEYSICFQGASLDEGNQGCCALTASFIKLATDKDPEAKIYLLHGNRTKGVQSLKVSGRAVQVNIVNFRLSPKALVGEHLFWILFLAIIQRLMPIRAIRERIVRSNLWLKTLDDADFVGGIRGGDSFSDIYGLYRFLIGIIPSVIVILMRKDLVLLPQTYGPFKSTLTMQIARFVMMHAELMFARDTDSIKFVRDFLGSRGEHKIVRFCPDIAFVLESVLPDDIDIQPELDRKSSIPLIGLNLSTLLYIGGFNRKNMFGLKIDYKEFVSSLLKELMERTEAHVLLVPHEYYSFVGGQVYNEVQLCKEVRQSMDEKYSNRIHVVTREYDQNNIKGIIGLCDFFIGSRMHACIAALSQCIPAVGLAYSKKFRGVFQSIGAEQFVVDMRQKTLKEILETVVEAFRNRRNTSKHLEEMIPNIQKQISEVFQEIL